MLAEKFILFLEALRRSDDSRHADGAPKVIYTSQHVPVKLLPNKARKRSIPRLVAIGGRCVETVRASQR
ncbi:hypothetical protein [Bradyrhizobium erythrophlei]|uniref:Uncharacterized protein n=1 Tax=Bradyrhizobium erythrophlei TaxID=1437360 RepID=A0A1M7UQI5_9BRAD|nr:hypothetical protein [Bradyrhizobium erythrophlei]SHN85175.1 hypothetical protein SAMN05444170_6187 [Bradyrhizobium erythrophlei]